MLQKFHRTSNHKQKTFQFLMDLEKDNSKRTNSITIK